MEIFYGGNTQHREKVFRKKLFFRNNKYISFRGHEGEGLKTGQ